MKNIYVLILTATFFFLGLLSMHSINIVNNQKTLVNAGSNINSINSPSILENIEDTYVVNIKQGDRTFIDGNLSSLFNSSDGYLSSSTLKFKNIQKSDNIEDFTINKNSYYQIRLNKDKGEKNIKFDSCYIDSCYETTIIIN